MKRILSTAAVIVAVGAFLFVTLGSSSNNNGSATYKIQLDNAFGLVNGSDFKVAGVIAGTIKSIDLDQKTLHAVVTVSVSRKGFGLFRSDVFCQSRPQSLIGEYFVDCEPGRYGKVLPSGSTIPVTHTQSTIPADLVQNIMRLPYRQRFSLIINELGAAVASRSEDLQSALKRADPALAETDNLLNLLANDAQTIKQLNTGADTVITALANNNKQVQRFIVEANNISTDSATQASSITATWNKLPAFLQQLRPAMAKLGAAADAQDPVFNNLNAASSNLNRFFTDLVPFSHESVPSLQSLGQASATGQPAVKAATPTIADLNTFAKPTPELAQNLAIVLQALDARKRTATAGGPVEPDPRSPQGGIGYTGLEGLLMYAFNQGQAINYFGPYGHELGVDLFYDSACSPYATPQTIANSLASYQSGQSTINPRSCYGYLGPNQPGVTTTDPSNPSACVPDPGGAPTFPGYSTYGYQGTKTSACKLSASSGAAADTGNSKKQARRPAVKAAAPARGSPAGGGGSGGGSGGPINLSQTVGSLLSQITGGAPSANLPAAPATGATTNAAPANSGSSAGGQAQQLLNYLLSP